jgi:sugar lactone lactonase YvrE
VNQRDPHNPTGQRVQIIAAIVTALAIANGAAAEASGLPEDTADTVIGQPDFSHPFANRTNARGLIAPTAIAVDASVTPYRLYIADVGNHRVLGYKMPLAASQPVSADLVIGQPDMHGAFFDEQRASRDRLFTPIGLAVDREGNLHVCDRDYNRVVRFDRPFETDTQADYVFGQGGSFETIEPNHGGVSASSLNHACGITIDQETDTLWIADTGNHRVLGVTKTAEDRRQEASIVLGQPDFRSNTSNAGGRSAKSLNEPIGLSAASGMLTVADTANHRVLIYHHPGIANPAAEEVLGQDGSFTTAEQGCSSFRLRTPTAVTLLARGPSQAPQLLVCDTGNHRALLFDLGHRTGNQPVGLWGQGRNLHGDTPNAGGTGPDTLAGPAGVAVAPDTTIWIADAGNNRVLGFGRKNRGATIQETEEAGQATTADHVIGQIDFKHATANFVDGLSLDHPKDAAIDRSIVPNRLYICDSENNRILGYASVSDLGPERRPTLILGQADEFSNKAGAGRSSLCIPSALAVDRQGGLFVADRENNRVLWFENPFRTDSQADRVIGQPDFDSYEPNRGGISARSLNRPEGLAVDAAGNLYVADTRNHRILRFDTAAQTDGVADAVWGQDRDFTRGAEFGGHGVRSDTFSYPFGVDLRPDGLLAVADTNNHRVLLFDVRTDKPSSAVKVFGQNGGFSGRQDNRGGCSETSLSGPESVLFAPGGLLVGDTANCRIVYHEDVQGDQTRASKVYGQEGSFRRKGPHPARVSARSLWFPSGMDFDCRENLYVADRGQSRVLIFRSAGRTLPGDRPDEKTGRVVCTSTSAPVPSE